MFNQRNIYQNNGYKPLKRYGCHCKLNRSTLEKVEKIRKIAMKLNMKKIEFIINYQFYGDILISIRLPEHKHGLRVISVVNQQNTYVQCIDIYSFSDDIFIYEYSETYPCRN